jgi:hypothetical protein
MARIASAGLSVASLEVDDTALLLANVSDAGCELHFAAPGAMQRIE